MCYPYDVTQSLPQYEPYCRSDKQIHRTEKPRKIQPLANAANQQKNNYFNDVSVAAVYSSRNEDSKDYESLCQAIFGAYLSILDRKAVKQKEM